MSWCFHYLDKNGYDSRIHNFKTKKRKHIRKCNTIQLGAATKARCPVHHVGIHLSPCLPSRRCRWSWFLSVNTWARIQIPTRLSHGPMGLELPMLPVSLPGPYFSPLALSVWLKSFFLPKAKQDFARQWTYEILAIFAIAIAIAIASLFVDLVVSIGPLHGQLQLLIHTVSPCNINALMLPWKPCIPQPLADCLLEGL